MLLLYSIYNCDVFIFVKEKCYIYFYIEFPLTPYKKKQGNNKIQTKIKKERIYVPPRATFLTSLHY